MEVINDAAKILRNKGLRLTTARKQVLDTFLKHPHALAFHDIDQQTAHALDRVTIYRTLHSFTEAGLIHEILDGQATRYSLCGTSCDEHAHSDEHIHFKCNSCQRTFCLDHTHLPGIRLPEGYQLQELQVLALGLCRACGG